jgi:hypothetical protein
MLQRDLRKTISSWLQCAILISLSGLRPHYGMALHFFEDMESLDQFNDLKSSVREVLKHPPFHDLW